MGWVISAHQGLQKVEVVEFIQPWFAEVSILSGPLEK